MDIFTFDKNFEDRLEDYTQILSYDDKIIPASQIQNEWSHYLHLVIEPVGWQSLWKLSRLTCEDLKVHYPTIVFVQVEDVDFSDLTALVKILAVQDDIQLPEKYDVPLSELYPTKNQQYETLDIERTAASIDKLRFFYNYLWMAWDVDDDDNKDWFTSHLESRIRLFYDMKEGLVISKQTCEIVRTLMREGREIQAKINRLELEVSDDEDEIKLAIDEGRTSQLLELHFRLQRIKNEMEVLENPALREIFVKNQMSNQKKMFSTRENERVECFFVWLGGSLEETIESLNKSRSFLSSDIFMKTINNLQKALENSRPGDIVLLGNGEHELKNVGGIQQGGTMKSLGSVEKTVISPKDGEMAPCLLDFCSGEVFVENLTVDLAHLNAGILVRSGTVNINNCKIFVSNPTVIKLGIVVFPGAKLNIQNTVFHGLGTAIVVDKTGQVSLNSCSFKECFEGIQLCDDTKITITNCLLADFKEYGLRMQTEKYVNEAEKKIGGIEMVENVTEISLNDCSFVNNGKADVTIASLISKIPNKQDDMMY